MTGAIRMATVNVHEAKTQLSRLLARVEAGEEIVIARDGKPVARLAPVRPPAPKRVFGAMKGKAWVGDEILEPLPEEELAAWE
jgi:prevent-host-death family protein